MSEVKQWNTLNDKVCTLKNSSIIMCWSDRCWHAPYHALATLFKTIPIIAVAWLLNNVAMHVMECISLRAWHFLFLYFVSQCSHVLTKPSLHRLDFFLVIFLWRLTRGVFQEMVCRLCLDRGMIHNLLLEFLGSSTRELDTFLDVCFLLPYS